MRSGISMEVRAVNIKKEFIRKGRGTNIFTAVDTCSLTLSSGQLTVIQGRSGGGKSTLINMLSGILMPTSGSVFYDDRNIYEMKDEALSAFRNEHIGFVPQGKSAIASLTVLENILLPLTLFGEKDDGLAEALMEQFSIGHLKEAMPSELSGGELRRMAIARAMIRKPEVIYADEPTGDLDDENTEIVFKALKKMAQNGAAVLMVTHESDASAYADAMYRMDSGKLG